MFKLKNFVRDSSVFWYQNTMHLYLIWKHRSSSKLIKRSVILVFSVCAIVVPWNYPLMMLAWKMAACLAAGNTVVLKPAQVRPQNSGLLIYLSSLETSRILSYYMYELLGLNCSIYWKYIGQFIKFKSEKVIHTILVPVYILKWSNIIISIHSIFSFQAISD